VSDVCLDENELAALLGGGLAEPARVHAHLDLCEACRELVALLARSDGRAEETRTPRASPGPRAGCRNPKAGDVIAGRYRLDERIGEGGAGVVWAATHLEGGRRHAIKILRTGSDEDTRRFSREARITRGLRHPNLADVVDVLSLDDGRPVMVMELLEGEPFGARLRRDGALALAETAWILVRVCRAVEAAHAQEVIHRDLKPENVFLLGSSAAGAPVSGVKVLDFGLAKPLGSHGDLVATTTLTQTGTIMGTPRYMAPEQIFGEKDVDRRADVWAIGAMLYTALAGSPPVEGRSMGEILRSVTRGAIVPLDQRAAFLPPDVLAVAAQMLVVPREERTIDLAEVREVLGRHAAMAR
jgi:eukaryotic-like serine/threonine-protein kinase